VLVEEREGKEGKENRKKRMKKILIHIDLKSERFTPPTAILTR
jgi:hypothetical protein